MFTFYEELDPIRRALTTKPLISHSEIMALTGWTRNKVLKTVHIMMAKGVIAKQREGRYIKICLPPGTHIYQHVFRTIGIWTQR